MAHVLTIIPKGFRARKKVQTLSCLNKEAKNIQQNIACATKVKQQLQNDIFEKENKIKQSSTASLNIQ